MDDDDDDGDDDVEILIVGTHNIFRICCTPIVGWLKECCH